MIFLDVILQLILLAISLNKNDFGELIDLYDGYNDIKTRI